LLVRSQTLYPTELRARGNVILHFSRFPTHHASTQRVRCAPHLSGEPTRASHGLLRLDLLDVLHQIVYTHCTLVLVRTHVAEDVTPYRHVSRAVCRYVILAVDYTLHLKFRIFATVFPADLSQVGRLHLQGRSRRSRTFRVAPMAD